MGSRERGVRTGAQNPGGAVLQYLCPTQRPQDAPSRCEVRSVCGRSRLRLGTQPGARLAPPTPTVALAEPIRQVPGAAQKGARSCLRPQPAHRPLPAPSDLCSRPPASNRHRQGRGRPGGGGGESAAGGLGMHPHLGHPVGPALSLCKNAKCAFLLEDRVPRSLFFVVRE